MFESPNLDRFLRRARQFLDEQKYQEAIAILQTVIEGGTLEARRLGATEPDPPAAAAPPDGGTQSARPPADSEQARAEERARRAVPSQTVFSADGRISRPARRLCHEYLSGMPTIGLELYQTIYEGLARDLFEQALRDGGVSQLEVVTNRYFVTLAAGQAMQVLADRQMHEGRYRAAVQVLRDLSELYPAANLERLHISRLWCRFKIALCLRLAGEVGAALDAVKQLAADFPDESLRVMGELQPVRALAESPLFAAGDQSVVADVRDPAAPGLSWLTPTTEELVPLWQYRFRGASPYATVQVRRNNEVQFMGEGVVSNAAP